MANPEDRGNPAVPVMELIMQLEQKIRDKNVIIANLKEEVRDWRNKFLLAVSIQSPLFWIGMLIGQTPWVLWLSFFLKGLHGK